MIILYGRAPDCLLVARDIRLYKSWAMAQVPVELAIGSATAPRDEVVG